MIEMASRSVTPPERSALDIPSTWPAPTTATSFLPFDSRIFCARKRSRSLVAPIKEVRGLPWIEQNELVHRVIADWLKRYELID